MRALGASRFDLRPLAFCRVAGDDKPDQARWNCRNRLDEVVDALLLRQSSDKPKVTDSVGTAGDLVTDIGGRSIANDGAQWRIGKQPNWVWISRIRWLTPTTASRCFVVLRRLTVNILQLTQVWAHALPFEKREHRGQVR